MIEITVDEESVTRSLGYLDRVRDRVLENVRVSMKEAATEFAAITMSAVHGARVEARTGLLDAQTIGSAHVSENSRDIIAWVNVKRNIKWSGKEFRFPLGMWFEEGHYVRGRDTQNIVEKVLKKGVVTERLKNRARQYPQRRQKAKGYRIGPFPYTEQAIDAARSPIAEIINAAVREATEQNVSSL